jgi:hypothetical protein
MSPEELDRVIAVAAERYRAMTPADFRRERRAERWARIRAWWRRTAPEEWEDAAASIMLSRDDWT